MRDPQGFTEIINDQIRRNLYKPLPCDHLIYKDVFASLIDDGLLVPLSWESETQATSPRIPFITYPYEWCNAQFVDAAWCQTKPYRSSTCSMDLPKNRMNVPLIIVSPQKISIKNIETNNGLLAPYQ